MIAASENFPTRLIARIDVAVGIAMLMPSIGIRSKAWACERAQSAGRDVLIEPINRREMPGYFLSLLRNAHAVLAAVQSPRLKVQMDLYLRALARDDRHAC